MTDCVLPEVRFRAMEPEDLDVLYSIENDTALWGVGVTNVPYSRYLLHDYIATATGDIYTDQQVRLIIENGVGESIGILDITSFDPRHQRAEIGIVIQRQYRGQGYGTAAILRAKVYCKEVLHLHQLYVYVGSENKQSLAAFRKSGFQRSLELKDWFFSGEKYQDAVLFQYFL